MNTEFIGYHVAKPNCIDTQGEFLCLSGDCSLRVIRMPGMPPGYLYSPGRVAPILSENRMVFLDGCETELFGVGAYHPDRGCAELRTAEPDH